MAEESFEGFDPKSFVERRIEEGKSEEQKRQELFKKIDKQVTPPVKTQIPKKKLKLKKGFKKIFSSKRSSSKGAEKIRKKLFARKLSFGSSSRLPSHKKKLTKFQKTQRLRILQQNRNSLSPQSNRRLDEVLEKYYADQRKEKLQAKQRSNQLSPHTQRMLDQVRFIQNKGHRDNQRMQRILRERNIVGHSMNLMKAHENMIDVSMDFTKLPEGDKSILNAENIFREDPLNNPSIMKSNRPSILDTKSAGNNLF